jgi:hypothetical protein
MKKLFTLLILVNSAWAQEDVARMKKIMFVPEVEAIKKGVVQYGSKYLKPEDVQKKFPSFVEMDAAKIINQSQKVYLNKASFVVKKPSTFFTYHQTIDKDYIQHLYGAKKVSWKDDNSFEFQKNQKTYNTDLFFDSDDMSSIKQSSVIKAITKARKLDPLSAGAQATVVEQVTLGEKILALKITNFISIGSQKTMVIRYTIADGSKQNRKDFDSAVSQEILEYRKALESYQAP